MREVMRSVLMWGAIRAIDAAVPAKSNEPPTPPASSTSQHAEESEEPSPRTELAWQFVSVLVAMLLAVAGAVVEINLSSYMLTSATLSDKLRDSLPDVGEANILSGLGVIATICLGMAIAYYAGRQRTRRFTEDPFEALYADVASLVSLVLVAVCWWLFGLSLRSHAWVASVLSPLLAVVCATAYIMVPPGILRGDAEKELEDVRDRKTVLARRLVTASRSGAAALGSASRGSWWLRWRDSLSQIHTDIMATGGYSLRRFVALWGDRRWASAGVLGVIAICALTIYDASQGSGLRALGTAGFLMVFGSGCHIFTTIGLVARHARHKKYGTGGWGVYVLVLLFAGLAVGLTYFQFQRPAPSVASWGWVLCLNVCWLRLLNCWRWRRYRGLLDDGGAPVRPWLAAFYLGRLRSGHRRAAARERFLVRGINGDPSHGSASW